MKKHLPHSALTLGISPCPNDTFIFDAWVNGRLGPQAPEVTCRIADVAALNDMALHEELDVVKVSIFACGMLRKAYRILNAGGAMGRGCGPLIVARCADIDRQSLADPRISIAVPGRWTTAHLLLSLYQPAARNKVFMSFDRIMPAVARGDVDAGLIIHEGRFTYGRYGLVMVADLGAWWEAATGLPLPLGGIVAKKSLGGAMIATVEETIRASLAAARANPDRPRAFMQRHAAEMDAGVMQQHVALYVNGYTRDFGRDGRQAIKHLLRLAQGQGLFGRHGLSCLPETGAT